MDGPGAGGPGGKLRTKSANPRDPRAASSREAAGKDRAVADGAIGAASMPRMRQGDAGASSMPRGADPRAQAGSEGLKLRARLESALNKAKGKSGGPGMGEARSEGRRIGASSRGGVLSKRLGLQGSMGPGSSQRGTSVARAALARVRVPGLNKDHGSSADLAEEQEDKFVDEGEVDDAPSSDDEEPEPPQKSTPEKPTPGVPGSKPPRPPSNNKPKLPPPLDARGRKNQRKKVQYVSGFLLKANDNEAFKWEQVNEEMLLRKVREIRKERGDLINKAQAPGTMLPSSIGGKGASGNMQEVLDPLGFGPIDLNKQCLGSHASGVAASGPVDEKTADRIVNFSPLFDPYYYLATVHGDATVGELQSGQQQLKGDIAQQQEQLRLLVKHNFESFVMCKNTMEDIDKRINEMQEECGTENLKEAILVVEEAAHTAFGPLLERQAQVDRIRSVQGFLLRFRTLFNLPSVMRGFVQRGAFDSAVHEYFKARSFSLPAHSNILKRVMAEVQKVVSEFREVLYMNMDDPDADQAQVENSIRLLLDLEPDSDPIWHYLTMQDRRIRGLLEGCVVEHEERVARLRAEVQEQEEVERRWRRLQLEANEGEGIDMELLLSLQEGARNAGGAPGGSQRGGGGGAGDGGADGEGSGAVEVVAEGEDFGQLHARLVRRLTAVLELHVPRFWKLALSVFAGRFAKFASKDHAAGHTGASPAKYTHERLDPGSSFKYTKHSLEEVTHMVVGMVGVYQAKVQSAIASLELAQGMGGFLKQAVEDVASACIALSVPGSAPLPAVQELYRLRVETATRFVQRVCAGARHAIAEQVEAEDWVPVPSGQRMKGPYAISSLPLRFRDELMQALDLCTHVLQAMVREEFPVGPPGSESESDADLQEHVAAALLSMFHTVKTTFRESFADLSRGLSVLAGGLTMGAEDGEGGVAEGGGGGVGMGNGGAGAGGEGAHGRGGGGLVEGEGGLYSTVGIQAGAPLASLDQKILMVMSNAAFSRSFLARELADKYHDVWTNGVRLNGPSSSGRARSAASSLPAQQLHAAQQQLQELRHTLGEIEEGYRELEESMGDHYIAVKAGHLGLAVLKYFVEDGTNWAASPPVKGLRDSALELMHPLVAVYAEVHAGCKSFVDKAVNTLAEGLMDAVHQVAFQHDDLQQLDCNAYCQLHLELDYFETLFKPFSSESLGEVMAPLRDMLVARAMQTIEAQEEAAASVRAGRAGADAEPREFVPRTQQELRGLAQQMSTEILPHELRRTRVNIFCFLGKVPVDYSPPPSSILDSTPTRPSLLASSGHTPAVYTPNTAPPLTSALAASLQPIGGRGQAPGTPKAGAGGHTTSPPLRGSAASELVVGLRSNSLRKPTPMRLASSPSGGNRAIELNDSGSEYMGNAQIRSGYGSFRGPRDR